METTLTTKYVVSVNKKDKPCWWLGLNYCVIFDRKWAEVFDSREDAQKYIDTASRYNHAPVIESCSIDEVQPNTGTPIHYDAYSAFLPLHTGTWPTSVYYKGIEFHQPESHSYQSDGVLSYVLFHAVQSSDTLTVWNHE